MMTHLFRAVALLGALGLATPAFAGGEFFKPASFASPLTGNTCPKKDIISARTNQAAFECTTSSTGQWDIPIAMPENAVFPMSARVYALTPNPTTTCAYQVAISCNGDGADQSTGTPQRFLTNASGSGTCVTAGVGAGDLVGCNITNITPTDHAANADCTVDGNNHPSGNCKNADCIAQVTWMSAQATNTCQFIGVRFQPN